MIVSGYDSRSGRRCGGSVSLGCGGSSRSREGGRGRQSGMNDCATTRQRGRSNTLLGNRSSYQIRGVVSAGTSNDADDQDLMGKTQRNGSH